MDLAPFPPLLWLPFGSIVVVFSYVYICPQFVHNCLDGDWCLNNLFYRILTHTDKLCTYLELQVVPESPPARHRPREFVSHPALISQVLVAGTRVHPTGERQCPVREFLDNFHGAKAHPGDRAWVTSCKHLFYDIGFDCIVRNKFAELISFVLLFISLRRVFSTLVWTRNT